MVTNLSWRNVQTFTRLADCTTEKVYTQTFLELLGAGSNVMLVSRGSKCHRHPPVEKGLTEIR